MCPPKKPNIQQQEVPQTLPAEESATDLKIRKKPKKERTDIKKLTIKQGSTGVQSSGSGSGLSIKK